MYAMEELMPIVGRLAAKYCAYESSSVTYERAEQLMEAVLYCIHEAENAGLDMMCLNAQSAEADMTFMSDSTGLTGDPAKDKAQRAEDTAARQRTVAVISEDMSARQAYERGAELVKQKTERALALYNRLMPDFEWYGSKCLRDTMVKGMPEFFKWYDCQIEPQNTILTLDYPVLRELSELTGIDRIYAFLECIRLEQQFLGGFPRGYVQALLSAYNNMYGDMMENICATVLQSVLGHVLAKKPLSEWGLGQDDHLRIQAICRQADIEGIRELLEDAVSVLAAVHFGDDGDLSDYLRCAVGDMAVRLKNAALYGTTGKLF